MKKERFKKNILGQSAFTVIEMVVSLSMISIVAALFIANYRTANKRTDLIMNAQNLAADLHLAQNNTLGLVKYNGEVPAGGWGIALDINQNYYTLFADLDAPGTAGYLEMDEPTEAQIGYGARKTYLPDGITVHRLTTDGPLDNSLVNITFLPPDPRTNIYRVGAAATSSAIVIEMKEGRNESLKTLRVNFLGLIEVLD